MRVLLYHVSRLVAAMLAAPLVRVRLLRPEMARRKGAWILAANHISHFDPPLIGIAVRRKIDWMGMAELFRQPLPAAWLRGIDAFPVDRAHLDRRAVRIALGRLRAGHALGMFPEGGIRDGAGSILEGAPARPGVAGLSQLTGAPVVPCVIMGSDRIYILPRLWRPGRRVPVWIGFGQPLLPGAGGDRAALERSLAEALRELALEMRRHFQLREEDLPRSFAARRAEGPKGPKGRKGPIGPMRPMSPISPIRRQAARALDFAMCALMNRIQSRHRLDEGSRDRLEAYMAQCEGLTPAQFFEAPAVEPRRESEPGTGIPVLRWETPRPSGCPANDRAHVLLFAPHPGAPTVLMLHALASTGDKGYRRLASRFNAAGWNACFIHLPYHYSRVPPGCRNGELAITPDLVRTGQGLRQGVTEQRQLMAWLRGQGVREFGLWATSYGGWIGALLLGIEADFRFAVLQAPIVDVAHAIWESAAARHLRSELTRRGITQALIQRHEHLTFPMRVQPACGPERVILAAGIWDRIVLADDVAALHRAWAGSTFISVEQGHFGFRMAQECFQRLEEMGKIRNSNF